MKIQKLISRFETPSSPEKGVNVVDPTSSSSSSSQLQSSSASFLAPTIAVEDSIVAYNLSKTPTKDRTRPQPPQSGSPPSGGRMRKALSIIRGSGAGGNNKLPINVELSEGDDIQNEQDHQPMPLTERVDDVIKSITERPSHHLRASLTSSSAQYNHGASSPTTLEEETSGSSESEHDAKDHQDNFHDLDSRRKEFSISEHSERTYVVDNKTVKSQNKPLPADVSVSSRTLNSLASSSRPDYTYYDKRTQVKKRPSKVKSTKTKTKDKEGHQAECCDFNLSGSGVCAPVEEGDEGGSELLPTDVMAIKEAAEKLNKRNIRRTRSRSRSTDGNRTEKTAPNGKVDGTPRRRLSRRMSPGTLSRRSNLSSFANVSDHEEEAPAKPSSESNLERPTRGSARVRKPERSLSAGRLSSKIGSRSPRQSRKEHKCRSQSPGDQRGNADSGDKDEGTQDVDGDSKDIIFDPFQNEDSSPPGEEKDEDDQEKARESSTSLRRSRGRSPGVLRGGMTKKDRKKMKETGETESTLTRTMSSSGRSSSRDSGLRRRSSSRTSGSSSTGKLRRTRSTEGERSASSSKVRSRSSDRKDRSRSGSPSKRRSKSREKHRERSTSPRSSDKVRTRSTSPSKLRSKGTDKCSRSKSPSRSKSSSKIRKNSVRSSASESGESELSSKSENNSSLTKSISNDENDTIVQPPSPPPSPSQPSPRSPTLRTKNLSCTEVTSPRRKTSIRSKASQRNMDVSGHSEPVSTSKPRARSPGALSRPAKTLRATQAKKSQSLSTAHLASSESNIISELPTPVRRKLSLRPPSTADLAASESKIVSELPSPVRRKLSLRPTSTSGKMKEPKRSNSTAGPI